MKTGHMVKKTERGHCIANILSLDNTMDYKVHIHDCSNENALYALKVIWRYIQT